jgi:heavy metal translocating P-type ATPase
MEQFEKSCHLCGLALSIYPIFEEEKAFCCVGCQAVFNILSIKNELNQYEKHPLFQQALKSGLISNPALIEQLKENNPIFLEEDVQKLYLDVEGLWCSSCADIIRLVLMKEKGIKSCVVDYATDLAAIQYAPRYISKETVLKVISRLGYRPKPLQDAKSKVISWDLYLRFIIAAFCSLNIMMFSYPLYATYFNFDDQGAGYLFAWLSFWTSLPVLGYSAWPIFKRSWHGLKVGLMGMEVLVVLGLLAAFGLSTFELLKGGTKVYFDSMTVIVVFVLLGKIIETKAKFSAKDSLLRLAHAIPRRGRVRFPNGEKQFLPLKDIKKGDILIALAGEKLVLDGVVVEGEGGCDESMMTGEALPRYKQEGDLILGGTLLQNGWIAYRVAATQEESALQRIIKMVEEEIGHKTSYVRAADQISRWFVPFVITFASLVAIITGWLALRSGTEDIIQTSILRAVSILLISCPCAIGIAAPLAESHLLNGLAKLGAIVRNRGCLAFLGKETLFAFDKTGTITEGHFQVIEGLEFLPEDLKALLKGMVSYSIHPICLALARSIEGKASSLNHVEELAGKGVRAFWQERFYYLGSADFMRSIGLKDALLSQDCLTTVYFVCEDQLLVTLKLQDQIRPDLQNILQGLMPAKTVLLSGDAFQTVQEVAKVCGFDAFYAQYRPADKKKFIDIRKQDNEIVCMIGDGINDAPALAAAQIGISVLSATDISIQVSDILLTTDRLTVLPQMRQLAIKGRRIIHQNLFWAFFYNIIGIGLAAFGLLSPIFAAFAMIASSLMVLFNAQRLSAKVKPI